MLLKLFLIVSIICFTTFNRLKAEDWTDGSGDQSNNIDSDRGHPDDVDDIDDGEDNSSGDDVKPIQRVTVAVNNREPPSPVDADLDPEYKDEDEYGGGGFIIDDDEGEDVTENTKQAEQEAVHVHENSLITHPGILAAIIVGGVLVLVCIIVFCVLVVCCVRKKDEGTYDLDDAMKQKLKYVAYTKAETSPDKEFFA